MPLAGSTRYWRAMCTRSSASSSRISSPLTSTVRLWMAPVSLKGLSPPHLAILPTGARPGSRRSAGKRPRRAAGPTAGDLGMHLSQAMYCVNAGR